MSVSNAISGKIRERAVPREEDVRGPFLRDQTAIIHSLPFRRLKHKTQVFFAPENDHICTRIEHVLHVATIAVTIVRGLNRSGWNLDEELAFAIGIGHDLGHAPFGHSGESALTELLKPFGGAFFHEINGLRVVDLLANDGQGLNLTFGVRDGIVCHNGERFEQTLDPAPAPNDLSRIRNRDCTPSTIEGCIVRFSDKIAYLGRDIEDGMEAGLIRDEEIPDKIRRELGRRNGEIIHALVLDLIESSRATGRIGLSEARFDVMKDLKQFNYERIYFHPKLKEYAKFSSRILRALFEHLMALLSDAGGDEERLCVAALPLDEGFGKFLRKMRSTYDTLRTPAHQKVLDYISGMTDSFALNCFRQITIPPPIRFPGA